MAKARNRPSNEVNAGSMADIAFLLLLFFLMTTTIDVDKGIKVKLPPWPEDDTAIIIKSHDRNTLKILINNNDELQVENLPTDILELKGITMEFVDNPNNDVTLAESPDSAIVSLKNGRLTSYDIYIQVQNELKAAYNELRNNEAMDQYGKPFLKLSKANQRIIRKKYPIKISEAEPDKIGSE